MSIQNGNEKTKILIVDSNPENIAQLTEILSPVYTIITASPENAFDLIAKKEEDIATAVFYGLY